MNEQAKLVSETELTKLSYEEQIQKSVRWMLNQETFTHAITLTFNTDECNARAKIREWDARINRKLLGCNWLKKIPEHISYYAFLEKRVNNPHYHLVAKIPPNKEERLNQIIEQIWCKLSPKGEVKIREIYYQVGWVEYITKELRFVESYNNMILSTDFK